MAKEASPEEGLHTHELYFTKDGQTRIGRTPPTAYAWCYPSPSGPTNLNKNQVFRPKEEESEKVVKEVIEKFEKEARPLNTLEIEGKPLSRMLVPEIELAIYWNRHPYEFRPALDKRAKSAMNLSCIGELLQIDPHLNEKSVDHEENDKNGSRRSSKSKRSRSSSANININVSRRNSSTFNDHNGKVDKNQRNNDSNGKNHNTIRNTDDNKSIIPDIALDEKNADQSEKENHSNNHRIPKILQVLQANEKRKFNDLPSNRQSINNTTKQFPTVVRGRSSPVNSVGIQVTLDDVTTAALKSTYLCPLHGQYKRGIDRRAKSGFRTDMSSTLHPPHSRCSRSKSKTKLVKNTESQTDEKATTTTTRNLNSYNSDGIMNKRVRSKTAGANNNNSTTKRKGNSSANNMLSEYNGNFRHPGHIADSENRKLRNKILSYCFTKHSIF